jgi:hypothetical protein
MPLEIPPALLHRRPYLQREHSAPAVLQHLADDVYESLPVAAPHRPSLLRRITRPLAEAAHEVEEHAEAGMWRLAMRAAWWWLGGCLGRRR